MISLCLLQEETPLFLASREGGHETVKVLLDHYANRDMTDHMDRLPRDIALERRHIDIVDLLDTYKLGPNAPIHMPGGVTSPNNHTGMGYNHQTKQTKSKSRKKNTAVKYPNSISPPSGGVGVPITNGKTPKPRKKKGDGESAANKKNQQQQLSSSSSPSSIQAQSQARHQSNSESSPMSTISPASVSLESHLSPPGYETSPYDHSTLILSSDIGRHAMDEFQAMAGQYSSQSLLDHGAALDSLINEWSLPTYKQQLPQLQPHLQQNTCGATLQNGPLNSSGGGSSPGLQNGAIVGKNAEVIGSVGHVPRPTVKSKNLPMSPTHMQAMQQHHAQQRASHGSPHHRSDYPTSFHPDGIKQQPAQQTVFSTGLQQQQHKMAQLQQQTLQHVSQQTAGYALTFEQYPTPPSHNSQHITDSPPHQHNLSSFRPDHLLTPSPDSPGHWSSSSPHSAHSDWSEGITSPVTHGHFYV